MLNRCSHSLLWKHMMLMRLLTSWNNCVAGLTSLIVGVLRWSSLCLKCLCALLLQWLSEIYLTAKEEHLSKGGNWLTCRYWHDWFKVFAYGYTTHHRRVFVIGCLRPRLVRIGSSSLWLIEQTLISFVVICHNWHDCILSWRVPLSIYHLIHHVMATNYVSSIYLGRWIRSGRRARIFQELILLM